MGFSKQEHWSSLSFPSPGDLPDLGIKSPALQADSLPTGPQGKLVMNQVLILEHMLHKDLSNECKKEADIHGDYSRSWFSITPGQYVSFRTGPKPAVEK